jgi:predicted TIM-barrel fold metal-dependent hydrolase
MRRTASVVADSDMHVMEPPTSGSSYIDPAWKHVAPVGLTELRRDMRVKVKSHVSPASAPARPSARRPGARRSTDAGRPTPAPRRAAGTRASQVAAMDAEGLDLAVLFPSRGLFVLGLDSPQVMGATGSSRSSPRDRARLQRLADDFCARTRSVSSAPAWSRRTTSTGGAETRRCVEQLGFKAIFLAPAACNRAPWHDRYYDPLWAECERLERADHVPRRRADVLKPDFSLEVLDKLMMWHTFSQPLGIMSWR